MPPPKRVLVADDQRVNRTLTMRRLEQLGFTVDAVENGLQVIEALTRSRYDLVFLDCHMPRIAAIQDALAARDVDLLAEAAHALKSGAGNVGAMRLYELCDQLENAGDLNAAGKLVRQVETEFRKLRS